MTKQERFVLLVVALLVLSKLGQFAREVFIAWHYGAAGIPTYDKHLWVTASRVLESLVNFGAGFWLFAEARAAALKSWVWAFFGLCFGLLGVALFYLVMLFGEQRASET